MRRSLRSQSVTLAAVLGALTLAAVVALLATADRMERNTTRLWHALESVRVTEELQARLQYHEREQRLFEATGAPQHLREVERVTAELRAAYAEARALAETAEEQALVDALARESRAYVASPTPAPGSAEAGTGRMLDRELGLARQLVELNLADARATLAESERWDARAKAVGVAVAVALVVGVVLALWSVRRRLVAPLGAVREALVRYRPGGAPPPAHAAGVREIDDIVHSFHGLAARIERQRETQLQFLSGVAHDLRTPLNALRMAAASVRPDRPLPGEGVLRERFLLVQRQVERLARMVEDLLDTTRIEAGQLSLELGEHDLAELAREAVALHRPLGERHRWETAWPEQPVRVRCDATRVSQVLNNLLSNALKYSPGGGRVGVRVWAEGEHAWAEVSDTGVGIPAAEHESIFEPFRRSEATRTTIPGVGLGLSVSRRILEAHGGALELTSEPGHGSTFRFRLPRAPGDRRAAPRVDAGAPAAAAP